MWKTVSWKLLVCHPMPHKRSWKHKYIYKMTEINKSVNMSLSAIVGAVSCLHSSSYLQPPWPLLPSSPSVHPSAHDTTFHSRIQRREDNLGLTQQQHTTSKACIPKPWRFSKEMWSPLSILILFISVFAAKWVNCRAPCHSLQHSKLASSEAHNVIIKLLTGTLVMAFAEDVRALSQWHLSVRDSAAEVERSVRGLFFSIFSSMSTLNFYVEWNGTGLVSLPLHNDLLPKKDRRTN